MTTPRSADLTRYSDLVNNLDLAAAEASTLAASGLAEDMNRAVVVLNERLLPLVRRASRASFLRDHELRARHFQGRRFGKGGHIASTRAADELAPLKEAADRAVQVAAKVGAAAQRVLREHQAT